MRILIMMSYFNRPKIVQNALRSILLSHEHHQDWELVFGDDSSDIPGRPIVEEVLKDHLDKVTFVHTGMTIEDKIANGIVLGKYCNEVMAKSSADVAIMLCDDDALNPLYLKKLSEFFTLNPNVLYCWSWVKLFNPLMCRPEDLENGKLVSGNKYNNHNGQINPASRVDASQVAWRLSCCKQYGARFRESTKVDENKPWNADIDKGFFEQLYEKCGSCHPLNFIGQYKGIHDYQMLWFKNTDEEGIRRYNYNVVNAAGELF